jgi:putative Mg2+ transporter-C (MgtC) family protein
MPLPTSEEILKLALAVLIGGLVGAEREYRDRAAGFRTMTLICVGATLFTIASQALGGTTMRDPARVAAQIVTGVGFLGAGVIMREGGRVTGITTAATIWLTAALGMGVGGGFYGITLLATVIVLATLWVLPYLERRIDERREERSYRIVSVDGSAASVADIFVQSGLRTHGHRRMKQDGKVVMIWVAHGHSAAHVRACDALIASEAVREFAC